MHLCWQPLKLLFDSDNLFVLERAFRVVLVFARCAGEFVSSRAVRDAVPPMIRCLRKMQSALASRDLRGTLARRQSRRLLATVAAALSELPELLELDEAEVDRVLEELLRQRRFAEEEAGETLSLSMRRQSDRDALWLKTNYAKTVE